MKDMKRQKITLRNDFHGTEITLRAEVDDEFGYYILSNSQIRKAKRALCPHLTQLGSSSCKCEGYIGIRKYPPYDQWEAVGPAYDSFGIPYGVIIAKLI